MEFHQQFRLTAILGAESSAAQDENHGMLPLQVRELPAFRVVIGKAHSRGRQRLEQCQIACEILQRWMPAASLGLTPLE
jgi:hypothetical protein